MHEPRPIAACIVFVFLAALPAGPRAEDEATPAPEDAAVAGPRVLFVGKTVAVGRGTVSGLVGMRIPMDEPISIQSTSDGSVIRVGAGATHSVILHGAPRVRLEYDATDGAFLVPFEAADTDWTHQCWECVTYEDHADSIEFLDCSLACAGCTCEVCVSVPCDGASTVTIGGRHAPRLAARD